MVEQQIAIRFPPPRERMTVVNGNQQVITDPCGCRFFHTREHEGAPWRYVGGEDCGKHFTNYAYYYAY